MKHFLVYEDEQSRLRILDLQQHFDGKADTGEEELIQAYRRFLPECGAFIACNKEQIPTDYTFRDAWYKGDLHEPVKVDFQKALAVHRRRLKDAAERKIAQLEAEYEVAVKSQNRPQQVASQRTIEILRSIHDMNMTHCKTINDIKYCVPRELKDVWIFWHVLPW